MRELLGMKLLPETKAGLIKRKGRGQRVTWEEAMETYVVNLPRYQEFFRKKGLKVDTTIEPVIVNQPKPVEYTVIELSAPIQPIRLG